MTFDCEYPILAETDVQAADIWVEGVLVGDLSCDLEEVCDPYALDRGLVVRCARDFAFSGPARALEWSDVRGEETVVSILGLNAWKAAIAKGFDPETGEWDEIEGSSFTP